METYYYFIITPNAKVFRIEIMEGRIPELEDLQKAVGGYIETVRASGETLNCTPYQIIGIVNDEGRMKLLADNPIASMVLHYPEPLVGNVVIAQVDDEKIVGFGSKDANEIGRRIYRTAANASDDHNAMLSLRSEVLRFAGKFDRVITGESIDLLDLLQVAKDLISYAVISCSYKRIEVSSDGIKP